MAQSTNDAYPTAIRLGLLLGHDTLRASLSSLIDAFAERGTAFAGVLKMGRTQLQDAVPMTLGQEFHAFATARGEDLDRLRRLVPELLTEVNHGGTGINADPRYQALAVERSIGLVTALNPHIGYENATRIAKLALDSGRGVLELVREEGLLDEAQLADIVRPENMIAPRALPQAV